MRIVALLTTFNEERFIAACLENFSRQGVEVYLCDNSSTDRTVEIAQQYLDKGLIGIETYPRADMYSWRPLLQRKEELAATLEADWFMHVDADEMRHAVRVVQTLPNAPKPGGEVPTQRFDPMSIPVNAPPPPRR